MVGTNVRSGRDVETACSRYPVFEERFQLGLYFTTIIKPVEISTGNGGG
jgi:hypothetical protein